MIPKENLSFQNGNHASSMIVQEASVSYKFKLIYFEDRGKADLIKMLLYLGKHSYEDIQIKQAEWTYYKRYVLALDNF